MVIGLATGIGDSIDACALAFLLCVVWLMYTRLNFGEPKGSKERTLRITIPEDLNYTIQFDDVFEPYTTSVRLIEVKTSNMGSLYKLKYGGHWRRSRTWRCRTADG